MTRKTSYELDNSAIMHLAVADSKRSNTFCIAVTMREDVDVGALQQAVDDMTPRFPTIMAAIRRGFFRHAVVPLKRGPRVDRRDSGLVCMTMKEIEGSGVRVSVSGRRIRFAFFHSLTDGFGGFALTRALLGRYLELRYGESFEEDPMVLKHHEPVLEQETEDSFLRHAGEKGSSFGTTLSYLSGSREPLTGLHSTVAGFDTRQMLAAAKHHGVSLTALLTAVMMRSVMQMQLREKKRKKMPVQIMVSANLRSRFPSRTLRNFALYALPRMEPEDMDRPFGEFVREIARQMEEQFSTDRLRAMITTNVRLQRSMLYRWIPLGLKCLAIRIGYHFFGGRTSSLTLTNLGRTAFPEKMMRYMENVEILMSPRPSSPYNCAVLSFGGVLNICFSRWCDKSELEPIFFENLKALGCEPVRTEYGT